MHRQLQPRRLPPPRHLRLPRRTQQGGGRTGGSRHGGDGVVDNVRLSSTALDEKSLVIKGETVRPHTLAFYQFEKDGFNTDSSPHGNTLAPLGKPHTPPAVTRLAEYCHVLFNANRFLYVD